MKDDEGKKGRNTRTQKKKKNTHALSFPAQKRAKDPYSTYENAFQQSILPLKDSLQKVEEERLF